MKTTVGLGPDHRAAALAARLADHAATADPQALLWLCAELAARDVDLLEEALIELLRRDGDDTQLLDSVAAAIGTERRRLALSRAIPTRRAASDRVVA